MGRDIGTMLSIVTPAQAGVGLSRHTVVARESPACAGMTRRGAFLLLAAFLLFPAFAFAKPLVADLSQYRIKIDSGFTGTYLLLFGARNDIGDIVVAVRGPSREFVVRKKERVAGIWVNRRQERFDDVPAYYALAASKPFDALRHTESFAPLGIGLQEAVKPDGHDPDFAAALMHHEQSRRLYSRIPQKISFMGESLFKLVVPFPDTIVRGNYSADVYLFNDGQLTSMQSIPLHVEKVGFDAFVYDFAHEHSAIYGICAVLLALGVGWSISTLMHRM